jgi:hypothetical protein
VSMHIGRRVCTTSGVFGLLTFCTKSAWIGVNLNVKTPRGRPGDRQLTQIVPADPMARLLASLSVLGQVSGNEFIALYERAIQTSFVGHRDGDWLGVNGLRSRYSDSSSRKSSSVTVPNAEKFVIPVPPDCSWIMASRGRESADDLNVNTCENPALSNLVSEDRYSTVQGISTRLQMWWEKEASTWDRSVRTTILYFSGSGTSRTTTTWIYIEFRIIDCIIHHARLSFKSTSSNLFLSLFLRIVVAL